MPETRVAVRVRNARMRDAERIAALSGQLGYPTTAAKVRIRLHRFLKDRDHAIWVAEVQRGPVIGWIHVFVKRLLESDPEAEIGGLIIDANFRGHGAGKLLVERAGEWAKTKHLKSVYLHSNIVRNEAHRFYQQLGYEIVKTQYAFRKFVSRRHANRLQRINMQSP